MDNLFRLVKELEKAGSFAGQEIDLIGVLKAIEAACKGRFSVTYGGNIQFVGGRGHEATNSALACFLTGESGSYFQERFKAFLKEIGSDCYNEDQK